ncbi:MAG: hypothetical protein ACR2IE_11890 [Candidatus Sumerlaeaceae bacterium]
MFRILVFAAFCFIAAVATAGEPVLYSLQLQDNRIVNLSGNYSFSSGDVNADITIVQSSDGTIGFGAFVTGAGIAKTFITSGHLKAANDTLTWSVQAAADGGFSIKFKGTAHPNVSSAFTIEGKLEGPAVSTSFTGTLVPQNSAQGMTISSTTVNDVATWQIWTPLFNEVGNVGIKGGKKNAKILVKEPFVKATFHGLISKNDEDFNWTSGPGNSVVKIGKMHLVVTPSQFFATLINSNQL